MIYDKVIAYFNLGMDKHHRYKSWEHCYSFFTEFINLPYEQQKSSLGFACLHLAFYLASWGMMRASSFLLQKDYLVHKYLIEDVVMKKSNNKFRMEIVDNKELVNDIGHFVSEVREVYSVNIDIFNGKGKRIKLSDTLVSKIILGIYGCVPAYDRYFIRGLKMNNINGRRLCQESLKRLVEFYEDNKVELDEAKNEISCRGKDYPVMKLIDMYFWQCGYDADNGMKGLEDEHSLGKLKIPKRTNSNVDEVRRYIREQLEMAREQGESYIDLRSGNIHKELGYINRMPTVCSAMESIDGVDYITIRDTPSRKSSTKVLRYKLKNN